MTKFYLVRKLQLLYKQNIWRTFYLANEGKYRIRQGYKQIKGADFFCFDAYLVKHNLVMKAKIHNCNAVLQPNTWRMQVPQCFYSSSYA